MGQCISARHCPLTENVRNWQSWLYDESSVWWGGLGMIVATEAACILFLIQIPTQRQLVGLIRNVADVLMMYTLHSV